MIRLDDAFDTDRDFLGRLAVRGLRAEIAVPTRLAELPDHLTWNELRQWRASGMGVVAQDRKSTRLNSSHGYISDAVFCLKKKKQPCARSRIAFSPRGSGTPRMVRTLRDPTNPGARRVASPLADAPSSLC